MIVSSLNSNEIIQELQFLGFIKDNFIKLDILSQYESKSIFELDF